MAALNNQYIKKVFFPQGRLLFFADLQEKREADASLFLNEIKASP